MSTFSKGSLPPATYLTSTLRELGYEFAIPHEAPGKTDFSYISAIEAQRCSNKPKSVKKTKAHAIFDGKERLSALSIVANYIRASTCHKATTTSMSAGYIEKQNWAQIFDEKSMAYLKARGYDIEDVIYWAWVLTSESSYQAALRLLVASNRSPTLNRPRTPWSVF